jgi:hypothetical protein
MVRRAWVVVRAQAAAWRRHRPAAFSAVLVAAGLGGALGGGWLVGRWCLGLVLIAESAGCVAAGLLRDTGPGPGRRGERTVADVLEEQRWRP